MHCGVMLDTSMYQLIAEVYTPATPYEELDWMDPLDHSSYGSWDWTCKYPGLSASALLECSGPLPGGMASYTYVLVGADSGLTVVTATADNLGLVTFGEVNEVGLTLTPVATNQHFYLYRELHGYDNS